MIDTLLWSKYLTWRTIALDFILPLLAGNTLFFSGWSCNHPNSKGWMWPPLLVLGLAITLFIAVWTIHATYPGEDTNPTWGRWARPPYRLTATATITIAFILATFFAGFARHKPAPAFGVLMSLAVVFYLVMVWWMAWCHRQLNFWVDARQWRVGETGENPSPWAYMFWHE
ncbi:hypothetical protein CspHIS471_0400730 [Cutaneotrichosporon sp. HIS471]|nr:hypothetical protein CspHIS471_0400730 [Cutaneotrichosporon sp. HIS471]